MNQPNPYDRSAESDAPESKTVAEHVPARSWRAFPMWWRVLTVVLVGLSFAVRSLDQAGGRLSLAAAVAISIFLVCLRCLWRPGASAVARVAPIAVFVGIIAAILASVRFDEMDGNMVPRRVSWRWEPAPDQQLQKLTPSQAVEGVDLSTTTSRDFPQFLGPRRDGKISLPLDPDWDTSPPELIWKKDEFGAGHSGFAAVNGLAVTLEQRGDEEVVSCYQIETGELVWMHGIQARHETVPGGVGPRSTPTIHEGRVYTMGATGVLHCLDGATGSVIWENDLVAAIGTTPADEYYTIQWGRAASPIIDQGRLIVPLGLKGGEGSEEELGATVIALDANDGRELWRQGSYQISYASPVVATLDGVRQIVQVCESQAAGFDADTGTPLWEYPWPGNSAGNASCAQATVIDGNRVLLSKAYAHGSALIDVRQSEGAWKAEKVWYKRVMKTKFTNPIVWDGYVYGLDDGILGCVDLETGKRKWKRGRYGHGQVLLVGDMHITASNPPVLLVQAEDGDVALVETNPEEFIELARVPAIDGRTWNNPCLYGDLLLVRNSQQAACFRLPLLDAEDGEAE